MKPQDQAARKPSVLKLTPHGAPLARGYWKPDPIEPGVVIVACPSCGAAFKLREFADEAGVGKRPVKCPHGHCSSPLYTLILSDFAVVAARGGR